METTTRVAGNSRPRRPPPRHLVTNILVRTLSFLFLIFLARFAYVITLSPPPRHRNPSSPRRRHVTTTHLLPSPESLSFYSSVFQDLLADNYLSPDSNSLCLGKGDILLLALERIGVTDSLGVTKPPFRYSKNDTYDFVFASSSVPQLPTFASEIQRTTKPGGFLVVHTLSKDDYSLGSLLGLFDCFRFVRVREINEFREVVLVKVKRNYYSINQTIIDGDLDNTCYIQRYRGNLIRRLEPLISSEPLKPHVTFKRNLKNATLLPNLVDISFKNRYIYIHVRTRNYGSSIGNWFKNHYPKQDKKFEIFAIEPKSEFHNEYETKKKITLLPFAAWTRNETLFFKISRKQTRRNEERGRGMGRSQSAQSSINFIGKDTMKIEGFDFAHWLKSSVKGNKDFVVVKMDVEGAEFALVPKLIESGAICLIDELFLVCHYNMWRKCCPGKKRSLKFYKSYEQCLDMFSSLRDRGVFVHQWW